MDMPKHFNGLLDPAVYELSYLLILKFFKWVICSVDIYFLKCFVLICPNFTVIDHLKMFLGHHCKIITRLC